MTLIYFHCFPFLAKLVVRCWLVLRLYIYIYTILPTTSSVIRIHKTVFFSSSSWSSSFKCVNESTVKKYFYSYLLGLANIFFSFLHL